MKQLKKEIKRVSPVLVELLIFLAYISVLSLFHTHLLWGTITAVSILVLIIVLIYVIKSNVLKDIKKRLIAHAILNLIFLVALLITILFSYKDAFYITYFLGIALNLGIEVEFIFYLGISELFSPRLSTVLSFASMIVLVITSLSIEAVTKDNWIIIGLIGAFLNHVLSPDNLLAIQNKDNKEIQDIITEYKLNNKFWILKGIGLSIILSWAGSIFMFNGLSYHGKPIPQVLVIFSGIYICMILAFIIYFIFSKIIIEIGEKQQKQNRKVIKKKKNK